MGPITGDEPCECGSRSFVEKSRQWSMVSNVADRKDEGETAILLGMEVW